MRCPCGLPAEYADCCGRFHRGAAAPTPELLMRSRYSGFAVGAREYLLATWHPSTRPRRLVLDGTRWLRLEVLEASGGLLDAEGEVRFRARSDAGVLEERSRFVRDGGWWSYLGPACVGSARGLGHIRLALVLLRRPGGLTTRGAAGGGGVTSSY